MPIPDFLTLPAIPRKPREAYLSAAIDGGLGLTTFRDLVEMSAEHLDFVKFGWGSSFITATLPEKIAICNANGVDFWIGGTAFEIAITQGKTNEMADWVEGLGAKFFEISDGSIEIPSDEKCELIATLSKRFRIFSEIGSKDVNTVMSPREWISHIREELDAGAWKIIAEGRESGTVGIYRGNGEVREGLLEEIDESGVRVSDLVIEAPQKAQQVWLMKRFGNAINLSNVPLESILNIAALRLGLRNDTLEFSCPDLA